MRLVTGEIALTFDDGPNPAGTGRILELLRKHAAKATFFVWGEQVSSYPDVVRDALAAGHSVQPHCWAHTSHLDLEPDSIRDDIDKVTALLQDLDAPAPRLWRPPYGHLLDGATREVAAERGLELVGWTVDPEDYAGTDDTTMYDTVVREAAGRASPAVVLLHDGPRERSDVSNTCRLVRRLLGNGVGEFSLVSSGVEAGLWEGPKKPSSRGSCTS
jgi:peptidoglycan/xylan/chitin deacetylase (PgdA/CDA1 family)